MDVRSATVGEELRGRLRLLRGELHAQTERLERLLQACAETTARMGSPSPPRLFARDVVRLGSAEVLVARQSVRHAGGSHRLTPTEWQMLAFLLAHPGEVHSRLELACGAWGPGFAERNSEVEVYISRLRRKLGPAGSMLETVRGRGYRLLVEPPPRLAALSTPSAPARLRA